ncbi:hypothetical protein PV458_31925 [Streptomyces sp. MN03-5084-2B]|nr:hypothetical protein [Streptomyces sp. MN03-5084-2B]
MNFEPSTPEEEAKLSQALQAGARFEIEMRVVAIALDEEAIRHQAMARIERASFRDANARTRVLERVQSDLAEAIGVLVSPQHIVYSDDIVCRSSSFKVRFLPDSGPDSSDEA